MTEQRTPLTFRPVPAVPIVVMSTAKGDFRVLACGGLIVGPTLCSVLDAAVRVSAALKLAKP